MGGTEYKEKHWYVFNFNDMFMATALWFNQVLCEYVPTCTDAIYKTSNHPDLAWLIFPAFYFIGCAILYELLLAFTVQVFFDTKEEFYSDEENKEQIQRRMKRKNGYTSAMA